ncbi:hypothetical protein [Mucilaginibacter sp.]|uniref:hypothetical protein n=1 Tax=Mucilaginibacter sp. TaxID=1882438 RepID=UPI00262AD692|nr:hypothetical protein [Mucilaginibacter sp.]MDB4918132.1 hypothetical protein [Mucilaginibacter sp.]
MKKYYLVLVILLILIECESAPAILKQQNNWQQLNLGSFKISVPQNWKYEDPGEQEDSFVGQITGLQLQLSFDYSGMGYANHLLKTEKEYLDSREWWDDRLTLPYWGTKTKVHLPDQLQKNKFPKANYIADLTYKGKTVYLPIEIPTIIKENNIQVDSDKMYVTKTIWPKIPGKGMTGIYIHSRSSSLNFQMSGSNLSAENQKLALKAFKTIQLKNK